MNILAINLSPPDLRPNAKVFLKKLGTVRRAETDSRKDETVAKQHWS